ncbi:MAG: nucleotide exchange factor GrpE [Deltaproteobacteria bacterium]|nr:nucleotide exchange factor GrpE [Deltaproteobacteria bacterium]
MTERTSKRGGNRANRQAGPKEREKSKPRPEEITPGDQLEPAPAETEAEIEAQAEEKLDPQEIIARLKDQILRLHAEFDNYRKRTEREMASFRKYAQESLIKDLLPQIDSLELALKHSREAGPDEALVSGLEMTLKGLMDTLTKLGLSRVEAEGQPFDPGLHEAVMCQEDPDHEENTVLQQTQTGYLLHDRLIRPAMVIVSQRPEAKEE